MVASDAVADGDEDSGESRFDAAEVSDARRLLLLMGVQLCIGRNVRQLQQVEINGDDYRYCLRGRIG